MKLYAFIPIMLASCVSTLAAQSVSVGLGSTLGTPGGTANLAVLFSPANDAQLAAAKFAISFPSSITSVSASIGTSANAASKTLDCKGSPGSLTCLVFGMNDNVIPQGTLANFSLQIAPTAGGTIPIFLSGVSSSDPSGQAILTTSSGGNITLASLLTVSSLNCTPATVTGPATSRCTVTISGNAPGDGTTVLLSSNSSKVIVPASVLVQSGQSSAAFTASASTTQSAVIAALTASLNGSTAMGGLTVSAQQAQVTSMSCTPSTITGPATASCTLTLSGPSPAGGAIVSLSSNSPLATVPTSVTVAAGQDSAVFTTSAEATSTTTKVTLTAELNESTATTQISVSQPQLQVSSLSCTPPTLLGPATASCTVTISSAAPTGGATVSLSSNKPTVIVQPTVLVIAAQNSANFIVSTQATTVPVSVTLTAEMSGSSATTGLTVTPQQLQVVSLNCTPAMVTGSATSGCTITLSGNAPAGGSAVALSSSSTDVSVASSILVPAGQSTATFTASVQSEETTDYVTVRATLNGSTATASLIVSPPQLLVIALSCTPAVLTAPGTSACQVSISAAAPPGGATVRLSSNNANVTVPASVSVLYGQISATFAASAAAIASSAAITLTAGLNGATATAALNVQAPPMQPSALSCSPVAVTAPGNSTCTITISGMAPVGGTILSLSSNNPKVTVPLSATIAASQSSVTFSAVVAAISDTEEAVITVQGNNTPVSFGLDLSPGLVIDGAANSASYDTNLVCSPGSLASVFGNGFTSGAIDQALAVPFPTRLAGVELAVGGVPASLLYVSDRAINFQCPNYVLSSPVMVAVTRANGETAKYQVVWGMVSPGIFTTNMTGSGQGVVFVAGTPLIAGPGGVGSRPAHPGESIEILATGLGTAEPPRLGRPRAALRNIASISITIGSEQLQSAQASPAPVFDGLWNIMVPLPSDIETGAAVPMHLNVKLSDGTIVSSNVVTIAIESANSSNGE